MDIDIDGNTYWFCTLSGEISSVRKWSTTTVTTSGGGGYIHPKYGGFINPPAVNTQTQNHQKFWIVSPDGRETEIYLNNFSCREGQQATIIWGALKGAKTGNYLAIKNDTTGDVSFFDKKNFMSSFSSIWMDFLKVSAIYFAAIIIVAIIVMPLSEGFYFASNKELVSYVCGFFFLSMLGIGLVHAFASQIVQLSKYQTIVYNTLEKIQKANVDNAYKDAFSGVYKSIEDLKHYGG